MDYIRAAVYIIIAVAIVAMLLVPAEAAAGYIRSYIAYREKYKEIEYHISAWTTIAKRYDSITEATSKGYAIAKVVLYRHLLEELQEERKRDMCS